MIKAKKGKVMCKGVMSDVLAEYTFVTRAIIEILEDDGCPRELAVKAVAEAHRVGTMTKQELDEEIKAKVAETMMRIANAMNGNNEEEGEADE
jgi:hypothetical protein